MSWLLIFFNEYGCVQAMRKFTDGDGITILDPKLHRVSCNIFALEKICELALQCLAPHRRGRPSMKKCAEILWGIRKDYKETSSTTNDGHSFPSYSRRSGSFSE